LVFLELIRQEAEKEPVATQRKHAREQVVAYRLWRQAQALPECDLLSIVRGSV
jgi:hypothetical protein